MQLCHMLSILAVHTIDIRSTTSFVEWLCVRARAAVARVQRHVCRGNVQSVRRGLCRASRVHTERPGQHPTRARSASTEQQIKAASRIIYHHFLRAVIAFNETWSTFSNGLPSQHQGLAAAAANPRPARSYQHIRYVFREFEGWQFAARLFLARSHGRACSPVVRPTRSVPSAAMAGHTQRLAAFLSLLVACAR